MITRITHIRDGGLVNDTFVDVMILIIENIKCKVKFVAIGLY